jgi:hypothetical protein
MMCIHFAHDVHSAGAAGGGDFRRVQLAGHCKHAVGVCDDGDKAGGADDGAAGAAGGGDIRGVQLAGCCKHAVVNMFFLGLFPRIWTAFFSPPWSRLLRVLIFSFLLVWIFGSE